jgi:hypothetical protein
MKEQFKAAFVIQRDGSKQILDTMKTYSKTNNDSYQHVIKRYQHVVDELDEIIKLIGAKQ